MNRKLRVFALAAALATLVGQAGAQDFVFNWNPRSGDVWVDTWLDDINQYGYRYREPFIDEMVRYYDAPRDLVHGLIVDRRWAPGDVYYACAIAQTIGRPCRDVVDEWERDHGQGWGVIAQRLGIKPGSAEFHQLKRGFVPTYDRWGRPIAIDDRLREAFPERGRAGPRGYDVLVLDDDRFDRRRDRDNRGNDKPGRGNDNPGRGNDKARGGRPDKAHDRGNDKERGNGKGNKGNGKGNGKGNKGGKGKDKD